MTHPILSGPIFKPPGKAPSPLDDFDPNEGREPWASYCPSRYNGGSFKLHRRRQDMTAAMARHKRSGCIGYRMGDDGRWVEIARFEPRSIYEDITEQPWLPKNCERCNALCVGPSRGYGNIIDAPTGSYEFVRKGVRLVEPLRVEYLCKACS